MTSERAVEEMVEALVVAHLEGDDERATMLLNRLCRDHTTSTSAFVVAVGRLASLLLLLTHPDPRQRLEVDPEGGPFGLFAQVVACYYDPESGERLERPTHRVRR